jgi:hypothetical protein
MPKGARKQMTDKQMTDKQMTDKQMTDKQMTDKQETEYENTKLIPDTLSLIEKELEKSREHTLKTRKETEELRKKRISKKKSKEEDSSSDSSSSSSSEDEKPKKKMTTIKLRENTKLTDSYNTILNEKAAKQTVDTLKKNLANVKKLKADNARLEKMLAEMSSDSESSSEDEAPKMSKKIKLTEEEVGESNAMSSMMSKAKKSSTDLKKETEDNLNSIKMRNKLKPIIKKLFKDEKISEDKYDKLLQYLIDKKYDKLITTLKKFPDYYKEEDSSSSSSSESENNLRRLSENDRRRVVKNKGLVDIIKKLKSMTDEKISKVKYKKLDCLNYKIMEFIREFLSLMDIFQITTKQMDISNKLITQELDLSIFKNLEELDCSKNSIFQIILPKSLKKLKCSENYIERLDIQDSQIEHLECDIDSIENINKLPKSLIYLFLGGNENHYGQMYEQENEYEFNFKYIDKYKIEIVLSVNAEDKIIPKLKKLLDQVKQIQTDKIIIFHMYECYDSIFYRSDRFLNKIFKKYEETDDYEEMFEIYVPYIKNKILKQLEKFYKIKINNLEYHGFKD